MRTATWVLASVLAAGPIVSVAKVDVWSNGASLCRASEDDRDAGPIVLELRSRGAAGLEEILAEYDTTHDASLMPLIDEVAGQHDAVWSRLYWYTDLSEALVAAQTSHRPILYLRLMGRLTDEYSCANSRFFRTVLYANRSVSDLLRSRFVLVWESERPVPVVTVDYGDGRVLKRTLTGNSAHYILDETGAVIDVLPGLFDAETFASNLRRVLTLGSAPSQAQRRGYVSEEFRLLDAARDDWSESDAAAMVVTSASTNSQVPTAKRAARLAMSKGAVESPILSGMGPLRERYLETSEMGWTENALPASLDDRSIALMRSQDPAGAADPMAFARTVANFEAFIAADTQFNNQVLRRVALTWLLNPSATPDIYALNQRVYSELFLTPRSDGWLGLLPSDTYTALPHGGASLNVSTGDSYDTGK